MLSIFQPVLNFFKATPVAAQSHGSEEAEQPEPASVTNPGRSRRALRRPDNHRKRKRLNRKRRR